MTTPPEPALALDRSLRRVHRSVLATLGVCAVVVVGIGSGASTPPLGSPGRAWPVTAIALAAGSILARSAPGLKGRGAVYGVLASLLLAGAIGLLAVALAWSEGHWQTALLYTVAGVLLAVRRPPSIAAEMSAPPSGPA